MRSLLSFLTLLLLPVAAFAEITIPEPSSVALLLGVGAAALLRGRGKK